MKRDAADRTGKLFAEQHVQIPLPLGFLTEPPTKHRKDYSLLKPCPCGFSSWDAAPGRSEPFCLGCRCWYGWWDREGGAERKLLLAKKTLPKCLVCKFEIAAGHALSMPLGPVHKLCANRAVEAQDKLLKAEKATPAVSPKPERIQPSTASVKTFDAAPVVVEFVLYMKLTNPLNGAQGTTRGAMIGSSVLRKKRRSEAAFKTISVTQEQPGLLCHPSWLVKGGESAVVTLTRVAAGKFDDDNLRAAFKSVRDGISDALGFKDDSDKRLEWRYAQQHGRRMNRKKGVMAQHEVMVRIEVRP